MIEGRFQPVDDLLILEVPQDDVSNFICTCHHAITLAKGNGGDCSLLLHGEHCLGCPDVEYDDFPRIQAHCNNINEWGRAYPRDFLIFADQFVSECAVHEQHLLAYGIDENNTFVTVG